MPSCTAPRPSPSPCPPTHHPVQAISLREAVAAQGRPRAEAGEGGGLARPGARPAPALAGAARARAAGGRDRGRAAGARAALRPGGQGDGDDRQGAGLRRVRHPRGGRVGAARRDRDLGAGSALVAVRAPGLACRGGEGRGGSPSACRLRAGPAPTHRSPACRGRPAIFQASTRQAVTKADAVRPTVSPARPLDDMNPRVLDPAVVATARCAAPGQRDPPYHGHQRAVSGHGAPAASSVPTRRRSEWASAA